MGPEYKIIDGILHYRYKKDSNWIAFSIEELSGMVMDRERKIEHYMVNEHEHKETINKMVEGIRSALNVVHLDVE